MNCIWILLLLFFFGNGNSCCDNGNEHWRNDNENCERNSNDRSSCERESFERESFERSNSTFRQDFQMYGRNDRRDNWRDNNDYDRRDRNCETCGCEAE